ncbi:hypothetical protein CPR19092_LGOLGGFK_02527 [Companilactobacillus paralimentarius]|jgi:RimK-like ATP-grasp domain.|uniref:hypothetical protein n=1 Tax=Companilactobacillus paralimentarius TaxID=83526 RepID=UPI00384EA9E6
MNKPFLMNFNSTYENLTTTIEDIDYRSHLVDILGINKLKRYGKLKHLVIFTRIDDPEIDYLGPYLLEKGIDYLRINAEQIFDFDFSLSIDKELKGYIKRRNETWNISDIDGIWFRHFTLDCVSWPFEDDLSRKYAVEQWNYFLSTISNLENINYISKYNSTLTITKSIQLYQACKSGFEIPNTIVTNSLNSINNKFQGNFFAKAVKHHNIETKPNFLDHVYGRELSKHQLEKETVNVAPTIIQNIVSNGTEIRVNVFGKYIESAEYKNVESADWHDQGLYGFDIVPVEIPTYVKERIMKLMKILELKVGTVDLVKLKDSWIFYEINPNGDWKWLEQQSKQKISDKCIKFLVEEMSNETVNE